MRGGGGQTNTTKSRCSIDTAAGRPNTCPQDLSFDATIIPRMRFCIGRLVACLGRTGRISADLSGAPRLTNLTHDTSIAPALPYVLLASCRPLAYSFIPTRPDSWSTSGSSRPIISSASFSWVSISSSSTCSSTWPTTTRRRATTD